MTRANLAVHLARRGQAVTGVEGWRVAMEERMKVVYVSGPYTKPDPCVNVNEHIKAADRLGDLGYAPLVPVLSHFWHTMSPHPYEFWIGIDLEFVRRCDAVLRLPGESAGADKEEALARRLNIPVFYSVEELDAEMTRREAELRARRDREFAEYPAGNV